MASIAHRFFCRSLTLAGSSIRQTTAATRLPQVTLIRNFAAPPARDIIKDLYVKEIKAYKPAQTKAADTDVKKFTLPASPEPPEFEKNLAADLATYGAEDQTGDGIEPGPGDVNQAVAESVFEQEVFGKELNDKPLIS